jgi:hypothetical protein
MDKRCPRKLQTQPDEWCPLAVLRLKAIRMAGKELTEEEEAKLPGCPWAISHQMSNYCFFKYMTEYGEGSSPSENEIAALLNIQPETVKKVEKIALNKMRDKKEFKEIKESLSKGESVIVETLSDEDISVYI